jgi:Queuosine biosynthesis protein QueC
MRLVCGPAGFDFATLHGDLSVLLYGRDHGAACASAGAAIIEEFRRKRMTPQRRAWDLLSIALSVTAADLAGHRNRSSDGWTRDFELSIAVAEPEFWTTQINTLENLLCVLTTDRWRITFAPGAVYPDPRDESHYPDHDCVVLLSGGLDSFAGTLDLVAQGHCPFAVSQSVRGDAKKQRSLAAVIGGGIGHLQLNHNAVVPDPENPPSQRGRSLVFFAYGALAATTLRRYVDGADASLFVCENGFISLNPPLTAARLGSLSTRTSHPVVLALLQRVLDAAGLRVRMETPYAHSTKGEMLCCAARQDDLRQHAHETTSCGRFKRFGYRHCGRCLPCLIRRAAFHAWAVPDRTDYVYEDLSIDDSKHARSDDVRAAAMAVAEVVDVGIDQWLSVALSSPLIGRAYPELRDVASRGLSEVGRFLEKFRIR